METKTVFRTIKEYIFLTLGIFLYCFSWTAFLIPEQVAGGGVTGLATIIYYATGIPVQWMYLGINAVLLITGTLILGRGFGMKTIYCIVLATLCFKFLPLIPWTTDIGEKFLNALLGGTLGGVGIALVFMNGGSSGGTDIIALIINHFAEVSPGRVFLICDMIIIGSILLLPGKKLEDVIYGYIQMVSFSYIVDLILTGNKQTVQILIFSDKFAVIADKINEGRHGVTAVSSTGWYAKKDGKVLIIVVRKYYLQEITRIVKEIDPSSFISVAQVMSVYGKGFDEIKTGVNTPWKKKNGTNSLQS
jgi:uncharacterized membrane-anchored protein YitT (DUF2179 family)